jgi:hypothetical protein
MYLCSYKNVFNQFMTFISYIVSLLYIVTYPVRYSVFLLPCSGMLDRYHIPAYRTFYINVTIWRLGKNNLDRRSIC